MCMRLEVAVPWWGSSGGRSGLQRAAAFGVAQRLFIGLLLAPLPGGGGGGVALCGVCLFVVGVRFGTLCMNASF